MSYRKGERTFKVNERDFPHIAEIDVPVGGIELWESGRFIEVFKAPRAR